MPTYEYRCSACDEHLEVVQSFKDDPLTDCPNCGKKKALRKVFSPVGIVFKGSGFYKTDNRGGGKKSKAKESESSSTSSSSSSGSSSSSDSSSSSSSSAKTDAKIA